MSDRAAQRAGLFIESRGFPADSRRVANFYRAGALAWKTAEVAAGPSPAWRSIGPVVIMNGQTKLGKSHIDVSGRVSAVAVDPRNPDHILVGAAAGGIWTSPNGGTTWQPLAAADDKPLLTIGALAFAPNAPATAYAGTGEGGTWYGALGQGLLASNDGGINWQWAIDPKSSDNPFMGQGFYDLAVHPNDAAHLFAGTTAGLHESRDGGRHWQLHLDGGTTNEHCWSLSVSASEILAAKSARDDQPGTAKSGFLGLFRRDIEDGNWVKQPLYLEPADGWIRLAVAHHPSNQAIAFAIGAYDEVKNGTKSRHVRMYRRDPSGGWQPMLPPDTITEDDNASQADYDWFLAVHEHAGKLLIFVGAKAFYIGEWLGGSVEIQWKPLEYNIHADQHAIAFHPTDSGTVYLGNDGGLFRSSDGGWTWRACNNGLEITEIEYLAQDLSDATWILAGTQDNGTIRYTGDPAWKHVADGDGGYCAVNQKAPSTVFHSWYCMGMARSTDKGTSWDNNVGPPAPKCPTDGGSYLCLFYPPLALYSDATKPVIAQAGHSIFIGDGIGNWDEVGLPAPTVVAAADGREHPCVASALCIPTPDLVLIGCSNGRLFRVTRDHAGNWSAPNELERLPPPTAPDESDPLAGWSDDDVGEVHHWISDIWADPSNPAAIWVTSSRIPYAGVFRSESGGTPPTGGGPAWHACNNGLTGLPVNAVEVHPDDPDRAWVAIDQGVYETRNGGDRWDPVGSGLPHALVEDILYHPGAQKLRVGTRSRGVWELDLSSPAESHAIASTMTAARTQTEQRQGIRAAPIEQSTPTALRSKGGAGGMTTTTKVIIGWLAAMAIGYPVAIYFLLQGIPPKWPGLSGSDAQTAGFVVLGAASLTILLMIMAVIFQQMGLSDPHQALGLPEGSVRALIALFLLMTFVIVSVRLFERSTDPALPQQAQQFLQQIFTAVLTLVTAVSSFYFGSRTSDRNGVANGVLAVTAIAPPHGKGKVFVTNLSGAGFVNGAGVRLRTTNQPDIAATQVDVISNSRIVCVLDVTGATTGKWDVVVSNPDNRQATLPGGFEVDKPS